MKKFFLAQIVLCITTNVFAGEPWAPISGYSSVSQDGAYNRFKFRLLDGQYGADETYEHETQVYNKKFADYAGDWSSNLPAKYYDTTFLDVLNPEAVDNFTIGSARAEDLQGEVNYYTFMDLKKGTNCKGCCSSHGGVVCNGGVSQCADGTSLSVICALKGCSQCFNTALVRIKGQRGHTIIPGCTSTWCIFPDATTDTMCLLSAPQYKSWEY